MADSNDIQALEKISTEVDESQIKVKLATQCIKAQAFLVAKLKQQVQRNKETCGNLGSANSKLQSEITQAEQEIKSFHIAKETIRLANVELKKEWLVAKGRKLDIIARVKTGENKYEELWLEAKSRYESLPHVQNLLKVTETAKTLKDQISTLDKQAESLEKEIQAKKEACVVVDRKRVIELAQFIVHEKPKIIDNINKKTKEIRNLIIKLKSLKIDPVAVTKENITPVEETNAAPKTVDKSKIIDESAFLMPKLQVSLDIDEMISVKLNEVKLKKLDYTRLLATKEPTYFDVGTSIINRKPDVEESISSYFSKPSATGEEKTPNYSRMKLINILDDVQIGHHDALDIISKVNPDALQVVESISAESKADEGPGVSKNQVQELESEELEEINMTSSNGQDIVNPPTQFLDESLKTQKSQKHKTLSFDLTISSPNDATSGDMKKNDVLEENFKNESVIKPLNVSAVNDDDFSKIQDMVLKKHNLDLTPPFVYAKKNIVLQNVKTEEKIVTSKFFRDNENVNDETKQKENTDQTQPDKLVNKIIEIDVEEDMMVSSPKKPKITDEVCKNKAFSGYLFSHGPRGLPESLDVSINTTGYEDGDDFPHCIDSNILLSPKADLPMCATDPEIQSQELPNFLSGLRKTGLSFFGCFPAKDNKPGTSTSNQGSSGFSFNFGGEEKKNRSGLFSMFQ